MTFISENQYLTGQILIAMPYAPDSRFSQAVIYVCGHDHNGAMGIILNRPLISITFRDFLEQAGIAYADGSVDDHIFFGGPLDSTRGFVLHTSDLMLETTVLITEEIALTATIDILQNISMGHKPNKYIMALGYTGWEQGQLEYEIQENYWMTCFPTQELMFSGEYEKNGVNLLWP